MAFVQFYSPIQRTENPLDTRRFNHVFTKRVCEGQAEMFWCASNSIRLQVGWFVLVAVQYVIPRGGNMEPALQAPLKTTPRHSRVTRVGGCRYICGAPRERMK